jgi:adenine-specific DNA methylase
MSGRMSAFSVAPEPTATKLRGGYYTPVPIARFLASWVSPAGPRLLEPSCGDGQILAHLPDEPDSVGIELDEDEALKAESRGEHRRVIARDFFDWFATDQHGRWDGVAGNPPFIRFQNWTEPTRGSAFDVMRGTGMRPTKLTNAWVPFVVASTLALRPGGRLGLVIPAEVLQVTYAGQLRAFLVDEFEELTVVSFKRLIFDGILQEVVLLLGKRGQGPAHIRVHEVEDAAHLPSSEALAAAPHAPALQHDTEKWTKYFLDASGIATLRRIRETAGIRRLGEIADVDVGVVTGRNQFFVLRPSIELSKGLAAHTIPLVSKSAHVRGVTFGDDDLAELETADAPCRLLALTEATELDAALSSYLSEGEAAEVHLGYKCSIRRRWSAVPSIWTPDAFLLRQIYDHPRIIANSTGATSTDTVHRIRLLDGTRGGQLAAASVNSITFAFAEVVGRSYGGGVLELEPREAEAMPFPNPHGVSDADVATVDRLLRDGDLYGALDYVDQHVLVDGLGLDDELVAQARHVWERLRDRRLARGRKTT